MKGNAKDYVSTAQQFFTAYDAHDVDGMLGLCADGALGRYAPYGRESVVPIRGGIDVIWRAFPNAVPNFRVKVIELIPTDGNTVVIQAEMSGPGGRAKLAGDRHDDYIRPGDVIGAAADDDSGPLLESCLVSQTGIVRAPRPQTQTELGDGKV